MSSHGSDYDSPPAETAGDDAETSKYNEIENAGPENLVEWAMWEENRLMKTISTSKRQPQYRPRSMEPASGPSSTQATPRAEQPSVPRREEATEPTGDPEADPAMPPVEGVPVDSDPTPRSDDRELDGLPLPGTSFVPPLATPPRSGCPSPVEIVIEMDDGVPASSLAAPGRPSRGGQPRVPVEDLVDAEVQADASTFLPTEEVIENSDDRLIQARKIGCVPPSQDVLDRVHASVATIKSTLEGLQVGQTSRMMAPLETEADTMLEELTRTQQMKRDRAREYDERTPVTPAPPAMDGTPEAEKGRFMPHPVPEDALPDTPVPPLHPIDEDNENDDSPMTSDSASRPTTPCLVGDGPESAALMQDEHTDRPLGTGSRPLDANYFHRTRAILLGDGEVSVDASPVVEASTIIKREQARLARSPIPGAAKKHL